MLPASDKCHITEVGVTVGRAMVAGRHQHESGPSKGLKGPPGRSGGLGPLIGRTQRSHLSRTPTSKQETGKPHPPLSVLYFPHIPPTHHVQPFISHPYLPPTTLTPLFPTHTPPPPRFALTGVWYIHCSSKQPREDRYYIEMIQEWDFQGGMIRIPKWSICTEVKHQRKTVKRYCKRHMCAVRLFTAELFPSLVSKGFKTNDVKSSRHLLRGKCPGVFV